MRTEPKAAAIKFALIRNGGLVGTNGLVAGVWERPEEKSLVGLLRGGGGSHSVTFLHFCDGD